MSKLSACLAVAVSALAACGGDDGGGGSSVADAGADAAPDAKVFMDAPPAQFDLSCVGNSPQNPPANIALSGFVQEANFESFQFSLDPLVGADVDICTTAACGGNPQSATTDAQGDFAFATVATGGAPFDAYLSMTSNDARTTFVYPGAPFQADQAGIPILSFGPGVVSILGGSGCAANEPILAIAVTDCANMPITDTANINIVVRQGGQPVAGAQVVDLSSFPGLPAEVAGLFIVCDVPANDATEVGATYMGTALRSHTVKAVANTTTTTQVRPGF